MKSGEAKEQVSTILEELQDYTEYHFEAEEKAMERHGYGGLEKQRKEHEKFVNQVDNYRKQLEDGNLTLTMELMNFLMNWLRNHLRETDAEYGDFFQEKDI